MCDGARRIIEARLGDASYYPDSDCADLRHAISAAHGISYDMVMVGSGIDHLVLEIALAFRDKVSGGLVTASTYPAYAMSLSAAGMPFLVVPARKFAIDTDLLISAALSSPRLVFLCNPHNPSGTVIEKSTMADICATTARAGGVLVVDEAYSEYVTRTRREDCSVIGLVRAGWPILALRTFSKAYGLAGLRVGYAVAARALIDRIRGVRNATPFMVNRLALDAARASIADRAFVERVSDETRANRSYLSEWLSRLQLAPVASEANFILVGPLPDSGGVTEHLRDEYRILVRDVAQFGLPGYIRVTVSDGEKMDRFMSCFQTLLTTVG